jgi:hypothetical protein
MRSTRLRTKALLAVLIAASFLALGAEGRRYALLIGNGDYRNFGTLKNPVNDATDVAAALKSLGFQVNLLTNANRKQMNQALNDFHDRLAEDASSVGFFWYAGHGIQSKGENYLVPVGADIQREVDLEDEAVSVRKLSSLLDDARNKMNMVVLDACRNNPIPSMGRSGARGLTVLSAAPAESIIMYSTGAGQVAADGAGRNSPFAQAFLKYAAQAGDITATVKAVTAETKRLTGGQQVPYVYTSLTQDFALNAMAPTEAPASASALAVSQGKEQAPSYKKSSMLFHLYALQGGKAVYPSNGELRLKREPFSLVFMIKKGKSGFIYANFSASSAQYDKARDLMPFNDLIPEGCGFADGPDNKDRYAILDNFGWHVWDTTFSNPEFIRFDKYYEEDGFVHAERGINKFYDLKNECDLSLSDAPTIYMTIVEDGQASDGTTIIANLDKAELVFTDD